MLLEDPRVKQRKCIAEEKVSEYLDNESYQIELIPLLEQLNEKQDDGSYGVDR